MPDKLKDIPFIEAADLRDYFAAHALAGIVADQSVTVETADYQAEVADWAYGLADAMLAQRAKG